MAFHVRMPNGSVGVDIAAVVDVLQDVVSFTGLGGGQGMGRPGFWLAPGRRA